jgi:hypothetical protein
MENLIKSHEKTIAHTGLALLYPVSVMGQEVRSNGIPHHVTVKFFDRPGVTVDDAHDYASHEDLHKPNPEEIVVTPKVFKNRFGQDVHVLALNGNGIDHVSTANSHGSHLGLPVPYAFQPHISVDKETHDAVASLGRPVKASELGIKFGSPELRHGPRVVATYNKMEKNILTADRGDLLLKGAFSNKAATTAALVAFLGAPQIPSAMAPTDTPKMEYRKPFADKGRMLRAIASVESSSGKDMSHDPLPEGGLHQGESAYGKYGLTPIIVRETVHAHPDLRKKYGKSVQVKGNQFSQFMKKNPQLEEEVAKRHLNRLHKLFDGDPARISMAWLNGITGTLRAQRNGFDFDNHWHVKKVVNAYNNLENTPELVGGNVADRTKR